MKFNLASSYILDLSKYDPTTLETPPLQVNGKPCLVRDVVLQAMLMGSPSDQPNVKMQKYNIAMALIRSDTPELSAEDVKCITDAVGQATAPLVYGQVCDFFNDSDNTVK